MQERKRPMFRMESDDSDLDEQPLGEDLAHWLGSKLEVEYVVGEPRQRVRAATLRAREAVNRILACEHQVGDLRWLSSPEDLE